MLKNKIPVLAPVSPATAPCDAALASTSAPSACSIGESGGARCAGDGGGSGGGGGGGGGCGVGDDEEDEDMASVGSDVSELSDV